MTAAEDVKLNIFDATDNVERQGRTSNGYSRVDSKESQMVSQQREGVKLQNDSDEELKEIAMRRSQSEQLFKQSAQDARPGQTLLGTFMGVFIPTTQNILGIILFIRLPWITGQAGIIQAAAIVFMACLSSTLTSLSMSGIATSGRVQAGGCYQIIKKSLGPEFGGVVGILLFLSNTFGVAMYMLGFVEALQDAFPAITISESQTNDNRVLGAITLGTLAIIVYLGISYISKFAVLFLTGVVLAIFSIFLGTLTHTGNPDYNPEWDAVTNPDVSDKGLVGLTWENFSENTKSDYTDGNSFASMLALFFPAVTDPLAGSNLSGDLKDAARSIPPGTLAAVAFTSTIFLLQVFLVGGAARRHVLISDKLLVTRMAWPIPHIIYAGIMLSTLGAGLQSLAGAPRLLAAIAGDDLVPALRPLIPKPGQEPRRVVILTATLSLCVLMLGKLDAVAPFITMWFLTCYAIINGACCLLAMEQAPGFRPTWKYFHWASSLGGFCICSGMMFFISWYYALFAFVLAFLLYKFIQRQLGKSDGELLSADAEGKRADWSSGIRFAQARKSLLALQEHDFQFKYWRPFVLFLCTLSEEDGEYIPQKGMINLISQLMKRGKGIAFVAGAIPGAFNKQNMTTAAAAKKKMEGILRDRQVDGFPEVIVSNTIAEGHVFMIQGKGFGVLRPNTVMMGFPSPEKLAAMSDAAKQDYVRTWKAAATANKTLMLCKGTRDFPDSSQRIQGNVDVWWVFDILPARGMLLIIPYLLMQHKVWKDCLLRLFVVTGYGENVQQLQRTLEDMLMAAGLQASVHVIQMDAKDAPRYTFANAAQCANAAQSGSGAIDEQSEHTSPPAQPMSEMAKTSSSISGLTQYLSTVSLNIEENSLGVTEERVTEERVSEYEPEPSSMLTANPAYEPSPEGDEPEEAQDAHVVSHHASGEDTPTKRKPRTSFGLKKKKDSPKEINRRGSLSFLSCDKYGSRLTEAFYKWSGSSALTLIALPRQHMSQNSTEYLESISVLIADLPSVIMIQECGNEKVQLYA